MSKEQLQPWPSAGQLSSTAGKELADAVAIGRHKRRGTAAARHTVRPSHMDGSRRPMGGGRGGSRRNAAIGKAHLSAIMPAM